MGEHALLGLPDIIECSCGCNERGLAVLQAQAFDPQHPKMVAEEVSCTLLGEVRFSGGDIESVRDDSGVAGDDLAGRHPMELVAEVVLRVHLGDPEIASRDIDECYAEPALPFISAQGHQIIRLLAG